MLRNPSSRVSLNMADVDDMNRRLKSKQPSHPRVAHTNWAYVHTASQSQNSRRRLPLSPIRIRPGAQRSRDASMVHCDPTRHVPQFAIYESAEDSDSSDTGSTGSPSKARLVHIAEVSPTITEVSGYNPPALVNVSPQQSPVRDRQRQAEGHRQSSGSLLVPTAFPPFDSHHGRPNDGSNPHLNHPHLNAHHPDAHFRPENNRSGSVMLRATATAFAPRLHYRPGLREASDHRSNMTSIYRRGNGNIGLRSVPSRVSDAERGGFNYHPRAMPRPRSSGTRGRPSTRAMRRPGGFSAHLRSGHLQLPAATSLTAVMDRYPVFPSAPTPHDPLGLDHYFPFDPEHISDQRGIRVPSLESQTAHRLYSPNTFSQAAEAYSSVRFRASSNSPSVPYLASAFEGPIVHHRNSSLSWNNFRGLEANSSRSSRVASRTSSFAASGQGETSECHNEQLLRSQSPLDSLTQRFRRLSTGLSARSQSSLGRASRVTPTDGRLLSCSVFYSDDEHEGRDSAFWNGPGRRDSAHPLGVPEVDERINEPSHRRQHQAGIAARIADVEADLQRGNMRPPSLSTSSQSASSVCGLDSTVLDSSPPADLPTQAQSTTPGRQLTSGTRTPMISRSATRALATPRVRAYDDSQPASTQPQTPADLCHRARMPANLSSLVPGSGQTTRPVPRLPPPEQPPLVLSRNPHRNTYPSSQITASASRETGPQDTNPYSPNADLRTAAAVSAVGRRRATRTVSNENEIDPSSNGMEVERETWMRRRENHANIMDCTPPRTGRFERYLMR